VFLQYLQNGLLATSPFGCFILYEGEWWLKLAVFEHRQLNQTDCILVGKGDKFGGFNSSNVFSHNLVVSLIVRDFTGSIWLFASCFSILSAFSFPSLPR